jgi:hypothetical protein
LEKGPFPCYWVQWEWLFTSIDGVSIVVGAVKEQREQGNKETEEQGMGGMAFSGSGVN